MINNAFNSKKISPFSTAIQSQGLRKCQREAREALAQHFALNPEDRHVIVQLPTGTGKTAVLAIAPFGLCQSRALIVTPGKQLADQLSSELSLRNKNSIYEQLALFTQDDLKRLKSSFFLLQLDDEKNGGDVRDNHLIVANYQQLFDLGKWFEECRDEIDLVIIDEAHHQQASTYQSVIEFFPNAKVIGLTGTPFRSDRQRVTGTRVYVYSYQEAIRDGVIRNFHHHDVAPTEVELTFDDASLQRYSLDEILEMSEDEWFQRQISMSEDCCYSIACMAKEKLEDLRARYPNDSHQIIASAMTVRHAREKVKPAFEKTGLSVGIVSSHAQDKPQNKQTLDKLRRGQIDVIVQVGMLGEGFDHRPLGVVAIFRPYKSLNPYIQVVGRVLRTNGAVREAFIVSHAGLNQIARFREFQLFDQDEQAFLQQHLFPHQPRIGVGDGDERGTETGSSVESDAPISVKEVGGELIDIAHTFVRGLGAVDYAVSIMQNLSATERSLVMERFSDSSSIDKSARLEPHPTDNRLARRHVLNESAKSIAMDTCAILGIAFPHRSRTFNKRSTDFAWIMRWVNNRLKKDLVALGIPENRAAKRALLRNEDFELIEASEVLARVQEDCVRHFQAKMQKLSPGA